jgi:solute carrier family 7 (L-type amino acid transporter), member 8
MALTVWLVCGLFSMVGAYCYAELGCMIKKAGGDYSYILDTFGPFIGFIRLWAECLIVRPCTIAIVGLTFATYASKPFFPECNPPDEAIRAQCYKTFYDRNLQMFVISYCLSLAGLSSLV